MSCPRAASVARNRRRPRLRWWSSMPRESSSTRALRAAALVTVLPPLLFAIPAYGQQAPLFAPTKQVKGTEVATVSTRAPGAAWHDGAWDDLDRASLEPG